MTPSLSTKIRDVGGKECYVNCEGRRKTLKKRAMQNRTQNVENEPLVSDATAIEISGLPNQMGCYPSEEPEVQKCCGSLVGQNNNQENFDMMNRAQKRMLCSLCSDEQSVATFVSPEPHRNNNHAAPEGAEVVEKDNTKSVTSGFVEPLMTELTYRLADRSVCVWYEPIFVNENPGCRGDVGVKECYVSYQGR